MADYSKKAPGVYVEEVSSGNAPIAGIGTSTAAFVGIDSKSAVSAPSLLTNFTEFKDAFPDLVAAAKQSPNALLVHAVHGFFVNGGTRCYVVCVKTEDNLKEGLEAIEPIDEISVVAAPGLCKTAHHTELQTHCTKTTPPRFAILDTAEVVDNFTTALGAGGTGLPTASDHSALYFPWIQAANPISGKIEFVPPSGHMAGVFARVDAQRGVHKAPANEPVRGALGLKYAISARQQDGLNPHGVNCLRKLDGAIKVWGARTVGGEKNLDFRYVNVRRLFNYLRGSLEQGTSWAVFEPNNADLWARITRNVSAFLTTVWAGGGLFGDKPEEAFYVKCDAETNPPAMRDLGHVVTEIGVAISRPAEFVVFKLGQKAAS